MAPGRRAKRPRPAASASKDDSADAEAKRSRRSEADQAREMDPEGPPLPGAGGELMDVEPQTDEGEERAAEMDVEHPPPGEGGQDGAEAVGAEGTTGNAGGQIRGEEAGGIGEDHQPFGALDAAQQSIMDDVDQLLHGAEADAARINQRGSEDDRELTGGPSRPPLPGPPSPGRLPFAQQLWQHVWSREARDRRRQQRLPPPRPPPPAPSPPPLQPARVVLFEGVEETKGQQEDAMPLRRRSKRIAAQSPPPLPEEGEVEQDEQGALQDEGADQQQEGQEEEELPHEPVMGAEDRQEGEKRGRHIGARGWVVGGIICALLAAGAQRWMIKGQTSMPTTPPVTLPPEVPPVVEDTSSTESVDAAAIQAMVDEYVRTSRRQREEARKRVNALKEKVETARETLDRATSNVADFSPIKEGLSTLEAEVESFTHEGAEIVGAHQLWAQQREEEDQEQQARVTGLSQEVAGLQGRAQMLSGLLNAVVQTPHDQDGKTELPSHSVDDSQMEELLEEVDLVKTEFAHIHEGVRQYIDESADSRATTEAELKRQLDDAAHALDATVTRPLEGLQKSSNDLRTDLTAYEMRMSEETSRPAVTMEAPVDVDEVKAHAERSAEEFFRRHSEGSTDGDGTGGSVSALLVSTGLRAREVVRQELELDAADGDAELGIDHAAEQHGGRVTASSRPAGRTYAGMMLSRSLLPGDCYAFDGQQSNVTVQLGNAVIISAVALVHVNPLLVAESMRGSAPRDFRVMGRPCDSEMMVDLGTFTYQHSANSRRRQTFRIDSRVTGRAAFCDVQLEVLSNHGSAVTCIYRFSVYGQATGQPRTPLLKQAVDHAGQFAKQKWMSFKSMLHGERA